jgi:hypothetical protein
MPNAVECPGFVESFEHNAAQLIACDEYVNGFVRRSATVLVCFSAAATGVPK